MSLISHGHGKVSRSVVRLRVHTATIYICTVQTKLQSVACAKANMSSTKMTMNLAAHKSPLTCVESKSHDLIANSF